MTMSLYCKMKRAICPLVACVVLTLCQTAQAKDLLLLTGAEGGTGKSYNYYSYVGVVAPLMGQNFGNGFLQKYWVDLLGYDYPSGIKTIDASSVGVEAALGYQVEWQGGWANAYVGARYANTWLSPDNPDSKTRGSQVRAKLQAEAEQTFFTDWKLNTIGSYILESDSYWARVRGLGRVYKEVFTGPELVVQGDPDYRAWQIGWVITGFEVLPKGFLGVKAGARITEHADTGGYAGIEFSKLF
jgi:hypothetical protein